MWRQFYITMVTALFLQTPSHAGQRKQGCGGTFTAARGILRTPNFPGPIAVPVRCQWIIDASNIAATNASIVVYLTQLFTYEGLTFTEYQLYGSDYKINPKVIHSVNETNISSVRWIQTYQSFLVIELKLESMDSTHLRVLDGFLDVFGFNVTYEITTAPVRSRPCTMMDCGFTGICYDYYTKFQCDCFAGYSGPNCSEGPKSLCYTSGVPICKNGGTCLHVGTAAVKCHCSKMFSGSTCETPTDQTANKECVNCRVACAFDGRIENTCRCSEEKASSPDQPGVTATLHISNLPKLQKDSLKTYVQTELLRNLQANISRIEELKITKLVHYMSGADVTFKVAAAKKEEKRVRTILNKWVDRGYVGNFTIFEKDNYVKTLLSLQSVAINQAGSIRQDDEFILSCVARGSPSMTFRWFKDGMFINVTATSFKWIKLIKDPHVVDQYTALLAVERAQKYDEGQFTCQVEDLGVQQCMSKFVKIGSKPVVKVEPMSITVRKGANFTIKCVTLEQHDFGGAAKYTYSWTKNKELLPVRTDTEKYEILYPHGTILQVFHAERDVSYSCLVQGGSSISSEQVVNVHVVDQERVHMCQNETSFGLAWPETAPDTDSVLECPRGFFGVATRRCMLKDVKKPRWGSASFSQCMHEKLRSIYERFQLYKLGYMSITPEEVLQAFLTYLNNILPASTILPGEGAQILSLSQDVINFMTKTKVTNSTLRNITVATFSILDKTMCTRESLLNPSDVKLVPDILNDELKMSSWFLLNQSESKVFHTILNTLDISILSNAQSDYYKGIIQIPVVQNREKSWTTVRLAAKTDVKGTGDNVMAAIIYRNISAFLSPKSFLRLRDGTEVEYEIFSQIITFFPLSQSIRPDNSEPVTIDFQHSVSTNWLNVTGGNKWHSRCGRAENTGDFTVSGWDINVCRTENVNDLVTRCVCPRFGAYVVLLTSSQPEVTPNDTDPQIFALLVGSSLGILLSLFSSICLATSCVILKGSCLNLLKLQCSLSVFISGVIFVIAVLIGPPQEYFMEFLSVIELFILLGVSSHLSKLLIVFTELIQLARPTSSKYTVIGIICGVPILTVFGSHLAYRTMDSKLKSWWLIEGTLAFNVFMAVISIITVLFILLYVTVINKLKQLIKANEKYDKPIKKRVALLRRSSCVFIAVLLYTVSSVVYINQQKSFWSVYQFSGSNVLVSITLVICYVLKSETPFKDMFRSKSRDFGEDKFFSIGSASSPLNFLTKQDAEVDNQSSMPSHTKIECQQFSLKSSNDCSNRTNLNSKPQSISSTFENCLHTSTSFCDGSNSLSRRNNDDMHHQTHLECYNSSPQSFRKATAVNLSHNSISPDILSSKTCVELDLVASSKHLPNSGFKTSLNEQPIHRTLFPPKLIITPDDAIAKILETESILTQSERTQPDGHDEILRTTAERYTQSSDQSNITSADSSISAASSVSAASTSSVSEHLDGVLDSISQDLDYLLNRNEESTAESVVTVSTLKRVSKPPGASVKNVIPEELLKPGANGVEESVTLRTSC